MIFTSKRRKTCSGRYNVTTEAVGSTVLAGGVSERSEDTDSSPSTAILNPLHISLKKTESSFFYTAPVSSSFEV